MKTLYAESRFSVFVSSRAWAQAGLDGRAEQELLKLQRQLDAFEEPDAEEQFALDAHWQRILAQVGVVTALLL